MTNQLEEELSPEIITLLQSDNDGIHFMFKPNTLLGGMERDGKPSIFGSDLTLPCSISQLAEWLSSQRIHLESLAFEGRNAMLNWLDGIMHSKPWVFRSIVTADSCMRCRHRTWAIAPWMHVRYCRTTAPGTKAF